MTFPKVLDELVSLIEGHEKVLSEHDTDEIGF